MAKRSRFSLTAFKKQPDRNDHFGQSQHEKREPYRVKLSGVVGKLPRSRNSTRSVRSQSGSDRIKVGLPKGQKGNLDVSNGGLSGKEFVAAMFEHYGNAESVADEGNGK